MAEDEVEYEGLSSDAGLAVCLNAANKAAQCSTFLSGEHGCWRTRESFSV